MGSTEEMMKRFVLTILAVVLAVNVGFCEVLKGEVSYDANRARAEAFSGLEKTIDMRRFSSFEKDYDYAVHYTKFRTSKEPIIEADRVICPFYKGGILYVYGIKYRKNPSEIFYYSAFGRLVFTEFVDKIGEYPHKSVIYGANGVLVSVSYWVSATEQFTYNARGKLKGHWKGDEMSEGSGLSKGLSRSMPKFFE